MRLRTAWLLLGVAAFIVASRCALATTHLYYFDNVNFALALREFNPGLHQPQPPGYPLFVGLSRLVHLFVGSPEWTLTVTGLIGAVAAIPFLFALCRDMGGPIAGIAAVVLLATHPAFWLAGIADPVRVFLALGSVAVAWAAWRSLQPGASWRWYVASAAMLGVAAGFRPEQVLFLTPLVLFAGWRAQRSIRNHGLALLAFLVTTLPWVAVTVAAMGGVEHCIRFFYEYLATRSMDAAAFGATWRTAVEPAGKAAFWTLYGLPAFVWALPLAWNRLIASTSRTVWPFLAVWFVPSFLFHLLVHIRHPDQALTEISALCVLGGLTLAAAAESLRGRGSGRWSTSALVAPAAVIGIWLFLQPPAWAGGYYPEVRHVDATTNRTFSVIRALQERGPVAIASLQSAVSWRQVQYYFPDTPLLVVSHNVHAPAPDAHFLLFLSRGRNQFAPARAPVVLPFPERGAIVWLLSDAKHGEEQQRLVTEALPTRFNQGIPYSVVEPGQHWVVGRLAFDVRLALEPPSSRPTSQRRSPLPAGTYDNFHPQMSYRGTWTHDSTFAQAANATVSFSNAANALVSLEFVGTGITWVYTQAPNRGQAAVELDGKRVAVVDQYSPEVTWQSRYRITGLRHGKHTVAVRVQVGNWLAAGEKFIDVDEFVVE